MNFSVSFKVAVISDTHGSVKAWGLAKKICKGVNLIVHLGDVLYHGPRNPLPDGYAPKELAEEINSSDVPVIIVKGNCDADIDEAMIKWPVSYPYCVLWLDGKLVFAHHGIFFERYKGLALDFKADLVLTGHTHISSIIRDGKTIFLNPGSASLPKGDEPPSLAIVDGKGICLLSLKGDLLRFEPWRLT